MPLVRIDLRRGKSPAYKKAIYDAIYKAMTEVFNVPENDRFMIVKEHDADNFVHAESYLGITYSDDLVIIQITANDTRTVEQKQAFFACTAELLKVANGGCVHQSRRVQKGKLVLRQRHRPIRGDHELANG